MKQQTTISGRECLLYTDGQPQVLLIQTLGGHEHNSIDTEVELIRKTVPVPFVMAAFAIRDWEAELTPWHDPEVSAAYDESCRKVREAGILLGVYTECDFDVWRRRGVQFMAIKNDTNALLLGYEAMKRQAKTVT